MPVDDRISLYGIAITNDNIRLHGIAIRNDNTRLHGFTLIVKNFAYGKIYVTDANGNAIAGASVSAVSTQTNANNYDGDVSGTTDSTGLFSMNGMPTTGTTLTIEADGFSTFIGPLNASGVDDVLAIQLNVPSGGSTSKKIYTTNKGNVLINPNDTILIELD